jgi:5'-methylthioadenosine phosphorylase
MPTPLAVLGGSGVHAEDLLRDPTAQEVVTVHGAVEVMRGDVDGRDVVFLARHGRGHAVPPHRIDYRANVRALADLGVERIVATAAVGAIEPDLGPGTFVLVDQFLDFTKSRPSTFHDGGEDGVVHVDVSDPYCPQVRALAVAHAERLRLPLRPDGTYVCTEGPRFETPAEIRAFGILGGTVVGMTGVPEVVLARELGLCYATVATVTNVAAGLSGEPLSHEEVLAVQAGNARSLRALLRAVLAEMPDERTCGCGVLPIPIGE